MSCVRPRSMPDGDLPNQARSAPGTGLRSRVHEKTTLAPCTQGSRRTSFAPRLSSRFEMNDRKGLDGQDRGSG